jgi:hypothetical protein
MPSHRVFLLLLNILVIPMACGPAAAQTQVLGPISDETPPEVCSSGWFVTGIRCTGSYCDNIEITCTHLPAAATDGYRWTPWVSEETFPGYCHWSGANVHCWLRLQWQILRQHFSVLCVLGERGPVQNIPLLDHEIRV